MRLPGFDFATTRPSSEEIRGAEALLGVSFPDAFVEVLSLYAGSYGDAEFSHPGSTAVGSIGHWFPISPWESESLWSVLASWSEHKLPATVVPIAQDGGGNYICLDYRKSKDPSVAFWFHELEGEQGLRLVASSFSGFVETLREPAA